MLIAWFVVPGTQNKGVYHRSSFGNRNLIVHGFHPIRMDRRRRNDARDGGRRPAAAARSLRCQKIRRLLCRLISSPLAMRPPPGGDRRRSAAVNRVGGPTREQFKRHASWSWPTAVLPEP